jgi:hypothetical protein
MTRKLIIAQILFLLLASTGFGQEEQLVINLPALADKRIFIFENPKGSIKVTGYDGNDIVVNSSLRFREAEKSDRTAMRRIEQNPLDISAETDGSTVTLYSKTAGKTVDFDIKIPVNFSLRLKSADNGNIQVININGEIEAENSNGDIILENITGSSVLNTVYGKISASFREVKKDSPMMFTSFEGDISLILPATANALLKMKTGTGEIQTDFDLTPVRRKPVVKNVDNTRIYSLEDWIVNRLNAGGPEYIIRSYNGSITIKKSGN